MRRSILALLLALTALPLFAVDIHDTRLVSDPAVSADRIAFQYANDLWLANVDGSNVRRLTSHPGVESGPRFSPDGKWITFTGRYEGNADVYVVSSEGGVPKRLTWHPKADIALGFTPDGSAILFSSPREVYTTRYQQLFTVPVNGGMATKLPIPHAVKAVYSADGKTIAYTPLGEPFNEWKHYRGGQVTRIVLFDTASYATEYVPQPAGRCNDSDPMFVDGKLYFRSDRDGEFNLYTYDRATKKVTRVTNHTDFPVLTTSAGAGRVIYEQAGYLHLLDPKSGTDQRLKIGVAADLVETMPRFVKGKKYIRNGAVSPTGARAAFEYRGEIFTLPREKGDDRNLTNSTNANDHSPAWSPDGKSIAYFSDRTGEYKLYIADQAGKGTPREIAIDGAGFYDEPKWSPDSKKVSFLDNSRSVYVADVASGTVTKVGGDVMYGPVRALNHAWAPDSQWLAYTQNTPTYMNRIWLYSIADKKSTPVTDPYTDATRPVFDPNGKYLYFLASTDAGPVQDWFAQSNADLRATQSIYLAVLPKGVVSPLAKESDEEAAKSADAPADKPADDKPAKDEKKPSGVKVVVDFDGLTQRIVALQSSRQGTKACRSGRPASSIT